MARPGEQATASRHPNRHLALTHEFALTPGVVTVARFSQSRNRLRLVIGRGDMLDRPLPYQGTAGVIRLGPPADAILSTVVGEGLEHHLCVGYGDVAGDLVAIAARLGLPVVRLDGADASA
jgi:hypothetical protein